MRTLLAIVALLLAAPANALQMCPKLSFGWAQQWSGPGITSISYDQSAEVMYVIFNYTTPEAYGQVPISALNLFRGVSNPNPVFQRSVKTVYNQMMVGQYDNCPILQETQNEQYVWLGASTRPVPTPTPPPTPPPTSQVSLESEAALFILAESGLYLLAQ